MNITFNKTSKPNAPISNWDIFVDDIQNVKYNLFGTGLAYRGSYWVYDNTNKTETKFVKLTDAKSYIINKLKKSK